MQENPTRSHWHGAKAYCIECTPIKEAATYSSSSTYIAIPTTCSYPSWSLKKQKCSSDKQFFQQLSSYNMKLIKAIGDEEQTARQNEKLHFDITAIQHQMKEDAKL